MHLGYPNYEQQYQIRAADGTIVWQGTVICGVPYLVESSDAAAITAGTAIIVDGPNSTFATDANPSTSDAIRVVFKGKAVVDANSLGFLGVASEPIAIGGRGHVAGPGSVATVRCTSAAVAVGGHITGSASAGLCAALTPATTVGVRLGVCIKANAQVGSTGLYAAGVLVAPN